MRFVCAVVAGASISACASIETASPDALSRVAAAGVHRANSWMLPEVATDNLLYVSDTDSGNIMVYNDRPGAYKFVGVIEGPLQPMGECVDANESLWTTGGVDFESYVLYRYPHGATSPNAVLQDPFGSPAACAVDRGNGDLAVVSMNIDGSSLPIAIYKGGAGKPKQYSYQFLYPKYLTYDNNGDLFVVGGPDDGPLSLVELRRGGQNLQPISIAQQFDAPGGIAWDGSDIAIADAGAATIYRFQIRGSTAVEVGSVAVPGSYTIHQLTIHRDRAFVPSNLSGQPGFVDIYRYPAGGTRLRTLRNFSEPYAAVVSLGPKSN